MKKEIFGLGLNKSQVPAAARSSFPTPLAAARAGKLDKTAHADREDEREKIR